MWSGLDLGRDLIKLQLRLLLNVVVAQAFYTAVNANTTMSR